MKQSKVYIGIGLVAVLAGLAMGKLLFGSASHSSKTAGGADDDVAFWTCSMDPQIKTPGPGKCPLCGMPLIPVSDGDPGEQLGPTEWKLSPRAERLAEIEVAPVERKFVSTRLRLVGKVEYDETRLGNITAWVPGRLDRFRARLSGSTVATIRRRPASPSSMSRRSITRKPRWKATHREGSTSIPMGSSGQRCQAAVISQASTGASVRFFVVPRPPDSTARKDGSSIRHQVQR